MKFELPPLPYDKNALAPHMSAKTLEFHHDKHHQTYLDKLKSLIEGKPEADKPLEEIICTSQGGVFNNAAQVWNHTFFWSSMHPEGGGEPKGDLLDAIKRNFQSLDNFKKIFSEAAVNHFGSGWAWLVQNPNGTLGVISTHDAANPLTTQQTPLVTVDVWEHAYYLDYQNARAKFVQAFLDQLINWDFASQNFAKTA